MGKTLQLQEGKWEVKEGGQNVGDAVNLPLASFL